jgi:hypothetical protein
MPLTLPLNQLLIRYVVTSPVYADTIRRYGTRKRYKCIPTLRGFNSNFDVYLHMINVWYTSDLHLVSIYVYAFVPHRHQALYPGVEGMIGVKGL